MIDIEKTSKLIEELKNSSDLLDYIDKYRFKSTTLSFHDYLEHLFDLKKLKKADVIRSINITRSYAYDIFSGNRIPSREKVIMLSYGLLLDYESTQRLLMIAKHNPLYPKDKRDSIIIYTKYNDYTLVEANLLLTEYHEIVIA